MPRKKTSEIISSGTPKQRIKLLIENIARKRYHRKPILSDIEALELFETFNHDQKEINLRNKWYDIDETVTRSLVNLQGLKYNVLMHYSNLRGYILVWHTMEESELLANSILHKIQEPERKTIVKDLSWRNDIMFSEVEVDPEGYLDFNIDFQPEKGNPDSKYSLYFLMNNVRKEAEESIIQFISWRQALVDFMKKEKFNIKTYKEILEDITDEVYRPIIGWDKYLSSSMNFMNKDNSERIDKMKSIYSITPDLEKLQVDKDIYNAYLKDHL